MTSVIDKQYGLGHKVQRLYVHWDVSTQCNFDCSYCYAKKQYDDRWGQIDTWQNQKNIISSIKISTLPVFLGLLGGEPTIHPNFLELYELCYEAISVHGDGRLYITTNGSRKTGWFNDIPYHGNVYFLWSFHPEFIHKYKDDDFEFGLILKNIQLMQERGFKNKVNILLTTDKQYWDVITRFSEEVEKIPGIELHPHFIYDGSMSSTKLHNYDDEFYEYFSKFKDYNKEFVIESGDTQKLYNDYDIFSNGLNKFKDYNCWNNNYEINFDGKIMKFCFQEYSDLKKDPLFFRKIKSIKPKPCPFDVCNCDGLLKILKERN